jgi:V8-like Glu-specific endopeptidase
MKKQVIPVILLAFAVLGACQTTGSGGAGMSSGLSPKIQTLIQEAVFEVVIKKPEEKNIVYDKELDWSGIPYAIRTDKYYSIGTAFAVSKTEAVTAFHVIDLSNESDVFKEYFIRDSKGQIYEVDTVVKASNEKDFLVFTVKGRTFNSWFEIEPAFTVGSQVYSIGNALGEGIVMRNGLVLGTVPEEEEGRWNLLKSSADGNPGNSGGPLVTSDGKVVGLVIALRDNILYSLPSAELLSASPDSIHFRRKYSYGHLLLSNRITRVFETDAALPMPYKELRTILYNEYKVQYPLAMSDLFAEAPVYLDGPNNRYILNQVISSDFPEFAFVDKNDDQWKLSDLKVQNFNLSDDGVMIQAKVSDFTLIKIRRPKTASLEKLNTDPGTLMDCILTGASMERNLGNSGRYRILSFGDPAGRGEYRDTQGRLWIKAWWLLDFEDSIMLAYILPLPNGPVVFMTEQSSHERHVYEYDMEAACNRITAAYRGNMEEWSEFLSAKKWIPSFFENLSCRWDEEEKAVLVTMPEFAISSGAEVLEWTSQSTLFLAPAYYRNGDALEYGVRTLILQRDLKGNDYFMIHKFVKPDDRLGTKALENWSNVREAKYPYDGVVRISAKDNTGSEGAVLTSKNVSSDICYTLYFSMENPGSEESLNSRFEVLEEGISIVR